MNRTGVDFSERFWAIRRAQKTGDVVFLRAMLVDPELRRNAARALGQLGDVESEAAIARLLGAHDLLTRCDAARALGDMPARASVNALIETACSDERVARMWATEALGKIGGPKALATLRELLSDHDRGVREFAAAGLERNLDRTAIAAIRAAANGRSWRERRFLQGVARRIEQSSAHRRCR